MTVHRRTFQTFKKHINELHCVFPAADFVLHHGRSDPLTSNPRNRFADFTGNSFSVSEITRQTEARHAEDQLASVLIIHDSASLGKKIWLVQRELFCRLVYWNKWFISHSFGFVFSVFDIICLTRGGLWNKHVVDTWISAEKKRSDATHRRADEKTGCDLKTETLQQSQTASKSPSRWAFLM